MQVDLFLNPFLFEMAIVNNIFLVVEKSFATDFKILRRMSTVYDKIGTKGKQKYFLTIFVP